MHLLSRAIKSISEYVSEVKSLLHFKVDPIIKLYGNFHSCLDFCVSCFIINYHYSLYNLGLNKVYEVRRITNTKPLRTCGN